MEEYFLLPLAVSDAASVLNCQFEDDIKGISNDMQMDLSILIWIKMITYEQNDDETFR